MNYKCPNCNAPIKFSPTHKKLYCAHCEQTYLPTDIHVEDTNPGKPLSYGVKIEKRRHDTIKMQILRCNSCAAELAMNNVEVSSYCAYCGQPSVELVRVEDYLKPDYIIPFKVSKSQAENLIRSKLNSGDYVPNSIKHIEPDLVRGIYVPFWLFDIYYEDSQYWKYKVDEKTEEYSYRMANTCFHKITIDASNQLLNDTSQRLEPYDLSELIPFDPTYLSGLYSDRFDTPVDEGIEIALERIHDLFTDGVRQTVDPEAVCVSMQPRHKIVKEEYALLPAWFFTFRYKDKPYTILVNGQTGKVVGTVPTSKSKVPIKFLTNLVISNAIALAICFLLSKIYFGVSLIPAIFGAIAWTEAMKERKAMKTGIELTRSSSNRKYAEDRQEEE